MVKNLPNYFKPNGELDHEKLPNLTEQQFYELHKTSNNRRTTMAFLDLNFDDVVEPRTVPGDAEYQLRIQSVREGVDKNGNAYLMPNFEIIGEVGAKNFSYFLGLPGPNTDAKQANNKKYKLKNFLDAFNLPYNSDPINDWIGAEGWAILGLEESAEWGEQNFVKKFVKSGR